MEKGGGQLENNIHIWYQGTGGVENLKHRCGSGAELSRVYRIWVYTGLLSTSKASDNRLSN